MRYEFKLYDENGDEVDHSLPGKMEVCPRCDGTGTHLTPSIGNHAYSAEEFYEAFSEPEDRAEYFRRGGIYDVQCERCHGKNVVMIVDEERVRSAEDVALLERLHEKWREDREYESERRAEREMGA